MTLDEKPFSFPNSSRQVEFHDCKTSHSVTPASKVFTGRPKPAPERVLSGLATYYYRQFLSCRGWSTVSTSTLTTPLSDSAQCVACADGA